MIWESWSTWANRAVDNVVYCQNAQSVIYSTRFNVSVVITWHNILLIISRSGHTVSHSAQVTVSPVCVVNDGAPTDDVMYDDGSSLI